MITKNEIKSLLHYQPETGLFTCISKRRGSKIGDIVGYLRKDGYLQINILGRSYASHRLAWLYMFGEFPKNDIDHIDGCKTNNRICNLRDVTRAQNHQNHRTAHKDNASGYLGVHFYKKKNKYGSRIFIGGKDIWLGYFDTPQTAHEAYLNAKRNLHEFSTI